MTDGNYGIMSSVQNELEMVVVSYFVKDKKYVAKILERGVNEDWFLSEDLKIFFKIAKECWTKYKSTFTKKQFMARIAKKGIHESVVEHYKDFYEELFGDKYNTYQEDDLLSVLDQFEEAVNVHRALEASKTLSSKLDDVHSNPKDAIEKFKKLVGIT